MYRSSVRRSRLRGLGIVVRAADSSSNSSGRYEGEEEKGEEEATPQRQLFAEAEKRRKEKLSSFTSASASGLTESEREALRSEWRAEFKKIGAERLAACYRVEYRKDEQDASLIPKEEEEEEKEEGSPTRKIAGDDDWDG